MLLLVCLIYTYYFIEYIFYCQEVDLRFLDMAVLYNIKTNQKNN